MRLGGWGFWSRLIPAGCPGITPGKIWSWHLRRDGRGGGKISLGSSCPALPVSPMSGLSRGLESEHSGLEAQEELSRKGEALLACGPVPLEDASQHCAWRSAAEDWVPWVFQGLCSSSMLVYLKLRVSEAVPRRGKIRQALVVSLALLN